MKKLILASTIAMIGSANAASFADRVCADLRSEAPAIKAPIAVTCHFPISVRHAVLAIGTTYFRCNPDQEGVGMTPVPAETSDDDCRNPFK